MLGISRLLKPTRHLPLGIEALAKRWSRSFSEKELTSRIDPKNMLILFAQSCARKNATFMFQFSNHALLAIYT